MTVSATYAPPQYQGNGATTSFAFPFQFFAPSDLVVNLFDTGANVNVTPQPVLGGSGTYDYTIVGSADPNTGEYPNGTIVFNNAPLGNHRVTIARNVPATQGSSLLNNAPFPAKTVEAALDRVEIGIQQLAALIAGCLQIPVSDPGGTNVTLPPAAQRPNGYLGFDSQGNPAIFAAPQGSAPVSSALAPVVAAATIASAIALLSGLLSDIAGAAWQQGDVMYYNGAHLTRLPAGTFGGVLTTEGAGKNPAWIGAPSIAGAARNLVATRASATSLTFVADEVIAETALGGTPLRVAALNLTLNAATVGAGGMDTGSQPTSGFLSVYLIVNAATGATALLGTTQCQTTIYTGANMPAGYSYSALLGLWPCGAGPAFSVGLQLGRKFYYQTPLNIATGVTVPTTLAAVSISAGVPAAAKTVDVIAGSTTSNGVLFLLAGDAVGTGAQYGQLGAATTGYFGFQSGLSFNGIPLVTAQTIYWADPGNITSGRLSVTAFTF